MLMNQRGPPPSIYQQAPSVVNNSFSWKQPGNRDRNSHLTASQQGTGRIIRESHDNKQQSSMIKKSQNVEFKKKAS